MKKLSIISVFIVAVAALYSCDEIKRKPGTVYMPDMAYSRAYETYADHSNLKEKGINYNTQPVAGTVNRGEELPYHLNNDSAGYAQSAAIKNPIASLTETETIEAERLYLINCGICHGTKLDGNGPLYNGGKGAYPVQPAILVGNAKYETMTEGMMYHSVHYGKNLMGSYASQLSRKQRWMIIRYIKDKQAEGKGGAAPAAADSTATAKK
jgi:mono/diheme cytochrome c family protein